MTSDISVQQPYASLPPRPSANRSVLLDRANPEQVKFWRNFALGSAGTSGIFSLVNQVHQIFPTARLLNFPDYESFLYIALAVGFMSAVFLVVADKIIVVTFAEIGSVMSLLYIGYSLVGIFAKDFMPVFYIMMTLGLVIMTYLFSEGIAFVARYGRTKDVFVGVLFLLGGLAGAAYPLAHSFLPLLTHSK